MCLGELAQVREVTDDRRAVVDGPTRSQTVSLLTLDDAVASGDWLLVHSGFALARLTTEEAREAQHIRSTEEAPS